MDRLHAMEMFVRVVETGSLSAAARHLRIGQPAVSKALAALEARLGVRLLVRSTRHVGPTEAGQAFYERALRAIGEADEAENAARGIGTGLAGRLRICAPVTFARLHVAPFVGSFLALHPNLTLSCVMDDRNIDLMEENIDVALRLGPLPDSALTARRLAEARRMLVGSQDYFARYGIPSTPADLTQHHAIVYSQEPQASTWHFRRGTEDISVSVPTRVSFTAAEGVREAVIAGLGLGVVSRWMMGREVAEGVVVPVLTDWLLPSIPLSAVFPAGRLPSAKARAFVTWFEGRLAEANRL